MKIDIGKVIGFLDDPEKSYSKQASSIIGVIGEDLNAYAFKDYMKHVKKAQEVKILACPVTKGTKKGKRLDRWIYVEQQNGEKILYQCEIKNWGATAIYGNRLEKNANNDRKWEVAEINWKNQCKKEFSKGEYPNGVTKVFEKMRLPGEYGGVKVEPLILYWMPISNTPNLIPLFRVAVSSFNNPKIKTEFTELNIFSVSIYLRSLLEKGTKYIKDMPNKEDMPNIRVRLEILDAICSKG